MGALVSLKEVAEELEIVSNEFMSYLNRETGEICQVSREEMGMAEDGADVGELPDWQAEVVGKAREILESREWLQLPTKFDVHEWAIMDAFSRSIEAPDVRDDLLSAIRGKGAFRYFKDTIHRWGIQDRWYQFKTTALEQIAAKWLDEHGIAYRREEDPASAR
jgi:hypothetical protein